MRPWMKRVRGVLGIGALWGALGTAVGATLGVAVGAIFPGIPFGIAVVNGAAGLGLFGLASGGCFAAGLAVVDRHKTLPQLTLGKHAAWGGWAGFVYSTILLIVAGPPLELLVLVPTSAFLGAITAGLATGSVLVAKRAVDQLPSGEPAALPPSDNE